MLRMQDEALDKRSKNAQLSIHATQTYRDLDVSSVLREDIHVFPHGHANVVPSIHSSIQFQQETRSQAGLNQTWGERVKTKLV
jgi:5,10-methylenetetrahydrofolate reductase